MMQAGQPLIKDYLAQNMNSCQGEKTPVLREKHETRHFFSSIPNPHHITHQRAAMAIWYLRRYRGKQLGCPRREREGESSHLK
jgi:hypothetical protein